MIDYIIDFKQDFNEPTKQHLEIGKTHEKHLEFFGKSRDCAVCIVDMMDSTQMSAQIPTSKLSVFYSTFLNSMADIVDEHNGKIVKNIGDALLFYFDDSDDGYFRDALRCGLDMIEKRDKINGILCGESLPPINYRVSADFGKVIIGHSAVSASEDIFGSVVNMCSKINPLANTNGMVIGNDFHLIVKPLNGFQFNEIKKIHSIGLKNKYSVYDVKKN
jgi:class 3 adenylate cyclase